MAGFKYEVIDEKGDVRHGVLNADSPRQARLHLRERGLTPIKVTEITSSAISFSVFGPRVTTPQLSLMTRQFASLVAADISVERALAALMKQTKTHALRQVLAGVHGKILEGATLSGAMGDYPKVFPSLYCALISAGEKSGELHKVALKLADHMEQTETIKRKLGMALIYPAIVTFVAIMVTAGLLVFVVPKVLAVFQRTHQELPLLTKGLIFLSDHLREYGVYWVSGIVALIFMINWLLKDESWRYWFHMKMFRAPLAGGFIQSSNATRLSGVLAVLVNSGVDVASSLETAAGVITNLPMKKALEDVLKSVLEGKGIAASMEESDMFPTLMTYFIATGEESDRLGEMLEKTSKSQLYELESKIATLVTFFEPLLILVMGSVVLIIVLAMLLPIFEMSQIIRT